METVLITGASGLVGSRLKPQLEAAGYKVHTLGRGKSKEPGSYSWNPARGKLDSKALEGVTTIIHLAGAGVADKRWTDDRKKKYWIAGYKARGYYLTICSNSPISYTL